jgi:hypothetical protein
MPKRSLPPPPPPRPLPASKRLGLEYPQGSLIGALLTLLTLILVCVIPPQAAPQQITNTLSTALTAVNYFAHGSVDLDFLRAEFRSAIKRVNYPTIPIWHQRVDNLEAVFEEFYGKFGLHFKRARITDFFPTVPPPAPGSQTGPGSVGSFPSLPSSSGQHNCSEVGGPGPSTSRARRFRAAEQAIEELGRLQLNTTSSPAPGTTQASAPAPAVPSPSSPATPTNQGASPSCSRDQAASTSASAGPLFSASVPALPSVPGIPSSPLFSFIPSPSPATAAAQAQVAPSSSSPSPASAAVTVHLEELPDVEPSGPASPSVPAGPAQQSASQVPAASPQQFALLEGEWEELDSGGSDPGDSAFEELSEQFEKEMAELEKQL